MIGEHRQTAGTTSLIGLRNLYRVKAFADDTLAWRRLLDFRDYRRAPLFDTTLHCGNKASRWRDMMGLQAQLVDRFSLATLR